MALRDHAAQWVLHSDFDKFGGVWIQAVEVRTPASSAVHRLEHPLPARPDMLPEGGSPIESRAEFLTAEAKLVVLPDPVRMAFTLVEVVDDALKAQSPQEASFAILDKALEVATLAMFQTADLAVIAPLVKALNDEVGGKTAIVDLEKLQVLADGMAGPHQIAVQKLLNWLREINEKFQELEPPPPPIPEEPEPEPEVLGAPETSPPPEPEEPEPPTPRPPEPPGLDFWGF